MNDTTTYIVHKVIKEANDTVSLQLNCGGGVMPPYKAGQFISIFFPETDHQEGKSYSISSSPHENYIQLTIKDIGIFSHKLVSKKVGDTIIGSLPYGYFYSESETRPMVMIAGGIGVTPFVGMIKHSLAIFPKRKITLLYSVKTNESIIFKKEFQKILESFGENFRVLYYCTQEEPIFPHKKGRILLQDIINQMHTPSIDSEFFICGSISFTRDYWRSLKAHGISEEMIYTEAFFN
jgi:ferredoxin-NADP reductase